MEAGRDELSGFFTVVMPHLNERQRRVVAGAMAQVLGRGGKTLVAEASGLSRNTVIKAAAEVEAGVEVSVRQRRPGGGGRRAIDKQPGLLAALDELVHPESPGGAMSLLRWTSKSTSELADALVGKGFRVSAELVRRLLHRSGYSLQAPAKQQRGAQHADRDGQFRSLNDTARAFVDDGQPVINVDTKKKLLVGGYSNGGRERHPLGEPDRVRVHDFIDPEAGTAVPHGVHDLASDEGWVSVVESADTTALAIEAIRRWWEQMGRARFPVATRLLIVTDVGGSSGHRIGAWKGPLARLATETGLVTTVCHHPGGTSKWNNIVHRIFSFTSTNRRSRPVASYRTIIELISAPTTTRA